MREEWRERERERERERVHTVARAFNVDKSGVALTDVFATVIENTRAVIRTRAAVYRHTLKRVTVSYNDISSLHKHQFNRNMNLTSLYRLYIAIMWQVARWCNGKAFGLAISRSQV